MKQDYIYNAAISAFVFYAVVGGTEKYKAAKNNEMLLVQKIREERKGDGDYADPTGMSVAYADARMNDAFLLAEISTLEAVDETMWLLGQCRVGREVRKAVNLVYFIDPPKYITKEMLKPRGRVLYQRTAKASLSIPASISEIYEWLAMARATWAWKKGLLLCNEHREMLKKIGIVHDYQMVGLESGYDYNAI